MSALDPTDAERHLLEALHVPLWLFDAVRARFVWADAEGLRLWRAASVEELVSRDLLASASAMATERLRRQHEDLARPGSCVEGAGLCHQLGLHVVVEGVETEEELGRVRALGCHEVQGYPFTRPMPAGDFLDFLERRPAVGRDDPHDGDRAARRVA